MIVIHHNPECGTSRNVLQIIEDAGYTPVIIEYLQDGWTRNQLLGLFAAANITPREALRTSKSPAKALGLLDENVTDETLINAMLEHPVLVNRPIVCSPKGVKLCRPSEAVLALLDNWPAGPYFKEDGEQILDEQGRLLSEPEAHQ
ncbi:arsenate reductase (glutaredoxin) [Vibrio rhizosphaerae]|uniref:arsenate reductase (glutaredoxin) n=1 Tax=Vibrio rhizosphaerae TaxID=398736 RepID=UPI000570C83B|nr:arsenate reductase (glutaredoxin) [Vibrio rhizosphaerae]